MRCEVWHEKKRLSMPRHLLSWEAHFVVVSVHKLIRETLMIKPLIRNISGLVMCGRLLKLMRARTKLVSIPHTAKRTDKRKPSSHARSHWSVPLGALSASDYKGRLDWKPTIQMGTCRHALWRLAKCVKTNKRHITISREWLSKC